MYSFPETKTAKSACLFFMLLCLLLVHPFSTYAQERKITGTITDLSDDTPLPGVNIVVKGTTIGTVTDVTGNYALTVGEEDETLVVSSVGYITEEISIGNQSVINVQMSPDVKALSEIVVVGYGEQSRREVTGAIASINERDIQDVPVMDINSMLQGRVAGVQVQQNSGMPGAGINIRVRGTASVNGTEPLYVIDGVPVKSGGYSSIMNGGTGSSALADLNPNDIASIEILKDASAAAIYGSRATNGVVLITTKRGKTGQSKVNLDISGGFSRPTNTYDLINSAQYAQVIQDSYTISGQPGTYYTIDGSNPAYSTDVDTDWQDAMLKDAAPFWDINFSTSGGKDDFTYALSLGYSDQQGLIRNSSYKRISSRLNLEYAANNWLKLGANIAYTNANTNPVDEGSGNYGVLYRALTFSAPTQKIYDEEGNFENSVRNPVQYAEEIIYNVTSNRVIANVYADFSITDHLKFRPSIAVDGLFMEEFSFFPSTLDNGGNNRQSSTIFTNNVGWINENLLTYSNTFGGKHNLDAILGYSIQEEKQKRVNVTGNQGATDAIYTTNGSAQALSFGSGITNWGLESIFSRFNYNYDGKYLVSAAIRRDGSSRFGKDQRYGFFPSVSLGWRISDEDFLEGSALVNDLKLRGSWGVTGSQNIGNFQALGLFRVGENYDGQPGIGPSPTGLPNSELTWETTTQTNIGFDLTLWDARVTLIADYYFKKTDDILFNVALPNTSGYSAIASNVGTMENKGFELSLSTVNVEKQDFQWTSGFNIAFNDNEVTSLPEGNDILFGASDRYYTILREGEPMGSFLLYQNDGLYQTEAEAAEAPVNTIFAGSIVPGDVRWRDVNEDGEIGNDDRVILGHAIPDVTGGFSNTFIYKNLSLDVLFQFSAGNKTYNMLKNDMDYKFTFNRTTDVLNAWTPENPDTDVPRNKIDDYRQNGHVFFQPSSRFLEDASYLRLKTITLNYTLPDRLFENWFMDQARVYISAQNLLTFTEYSGYDPEASQEIGNSYFGIDQGDYPVPATFVVGVNLGF